MLPRILDFTHALRDAGVPVAISEDLDALRALAHVPMEDKEAFRASLATTMIKSEAHRPAFDTLFDLYFSAGRGPKALEERDEADGEPGTEEEYLDDLFRALPEDLDFVRATRDEILQLRRAIGPLARRLATRLAMKKRHARKGRLDVRRTVRASLSTGGVPFDTRFKHRTVHKPELFILCDISGSVAAFARFTLMFVHAFQAQFSRVRSFVFVDTLDEVTKLFDNEDFLVAVDRMNQEADVVWLDGHSDYGTSLDRFWKQYGNDLSPRASVLVLGDARNNYRESAAWVVKEMRK